MTVLEQDAMVVTAAETESTAISFIGYDAENQNLVLGFKTDPKHLYTYANVSASQCFDLLQAESRGRWFNENLRNNPAHPFQKIEVLGCAN